MKQKFIHKFYLITSIEFHQISSKQKRKTAWMDSLISVNPFSTLSWPIFAAITIKWFVYQHSNNIGIYAATKCYEIGSIWIDHLLCPLEEKVNLISGFVVVMYKCQIMVCRVIIIQCHILSDHDMRSLQFFGNISFATTDCRIVDGKTTRNILLIWMEYWL